MSNGTDEHLAKIRAKRQAVLARLSDPARQFYEHELRAGTDAERLRQTLRRIDYEYDPVSVRQFIDDEFYLGRTLKGSIFPKLVDDLEEFFTGDYTEALLTGGIGYGKSRWMEIAIAYDIYQVSCLRDPAVTFGMISGSSVAFIIVSAKLEQARNVLFEGLAGLIRNSPYFQEVFAYDKKLRTMLKFPKGVVAYPATASPEGVLGEGIFSLAIDEANFMSVTERSKRTVPGDTGLYDQVAAVYNKASSRITSRQAQLGRMPGHIYVSSSARYTGDFTERMEKLAAMPEGKHIFVRHYATWGTRPPGAYTGGTFRVEVGDLTRRSRVLEGNETDVQGQVIEVPREFEKRFRLDTEKSVRDFAGIGTLSIKPFLVRREMIDQMFLLGKRCDLQHPYTSVRDDMSVTLQQPDPHYERLLPENLHWIERAKPGSSGEKERVLYPALRYAHIDLSKTGDATGLAVAYVVGTRMCTRLQLVDGRDQEVQERKPVTCVELLLRVIPPPHGEIDIPRVRGVLYGLARQGMEFGLVTFDTYGSQESVKTLKEQGYRADNFSCDGNNEAYEALKDAIYDGRVLCYPNPILQRELAQLENTGKKIDHPAFPGASKDLADCLAAVVHHCEEGWRNGDACGGMFLKGDVEYQGELSQAAQDRMMEVQTSVVGGQPMTPQQEDSLPLDEFLQDLLTMDDEERFGGKGGGNDGAP